MATFTFEEAVAPAKKTFSFKEATSFTFEEATQPAAGVDARTDPFFQTTPSDPYAGAAEEMVRPVTEALPAVTEDAAKALALMQYTEQTQPGRWTKQPENISEWVRFVGGGILSPIKQAESAAESALIAVGAAKPGDRLLYRPSEALERPHLGKPLPLLPQQEGNQFTGKIPAEIAGGLANAVIGFVNFLQTPEGTLSLGLGKVPKEVQRAVLGFWATKLATEAPKQFEEAYKAAKAGNVQEAVQHATEGAGGVFLSGLMAKHATFAPTRPSGLTPVDAAFKESSIPKTDQAVESVTEAKGPVLQPPAPTPTAVVSESGTVPVSAGNIPPARATQPLEEAQGRPTQPLSTEGAIKQAEPEQAVYPVRYSRETGGMVDALGRSVDAEHKVIGKPPPVEPISMGGATPAEFKAPEPLKTAVKNAEVDKTREARGLEPILGPERQTNPEVWDRVMQKIDADPAWQDRLIEETKKTPRALTPDETLALDHRYVDLQNEYGKAVRDGEQHMADGYELGVEQAKERSVFYEGKLNEVEQVAKTVGTESGRSLAMRRQLIKEDFSLASMESRMRAAKGFKPLTPEEHAQIKGLREKLDAAEKALAEADAKAGKRSVKAPLDTPTAKARARVEGLRDNFNQQLAKAKYEQKSRLEKIWIGIKRTRGAIVNIVSSYDFSAPRQALVAILSNTTRLVTNPVRGAGMLARPMGQMFKAWASEEGARTIEQKIKGRPNARSGADKIAGIEYTDLNSHSLTRFEENAHSIIDEWAALPLRTGKTAKTLAGAPGKLALRGVRMSNRAFITFLNSTRAELFDELLRVNFRDRAPTEAELRVIGNMVNIATGRGKLNPTTSMVASEILWAPRLLASRVQFLTGQPLWGAGPFRGTGRARGIVAREYARVIISGFLLSQVSRLFDDKEEDNPTSTDFGKIVRGNTRVDLWGGFQQVTVLGARGALGESTNLKGRTKDIGAARDYGIRGTWYTTLDFLRAKLRPDVAAVVDIVDRKDFKGDPTTVGGVAQSVLVPLPLRDIVGIMQEHGFTEGMILEALGQFGAGVSRYEKKEAQR